MVLDSVIAYASLCTEEGQEPQIKPTLLSSPHDFELLSLILLYDVTRELHFTIAAYVGVLTRVLVSSPIFFSMGRRDLNGYVSYSVSVTLVNVLNFASVVLTLDFRSVQSDSWSSRSLISWKV